MINSSKIVWRRVIPAILLMLAASAGQAQGIQLTPQQQQMLNQLPPAQRQQAMEALRQSQGSIGASELRPLNESVDATSDSPELSPTVSRADAREEPLADAGSRIVIDFTPKETLTVDELEELEADPAQQRLTGSHTFVLDDSGVLVLQGLEVIPLLGLSESDIERRLGAEPYLQRFDISARLLRVRPTGLDAIKPFGYEIFEPHESSFDPPMTGPVPPDYVLGPGDTVRVQLFGNVNGIYEYEVTRDGILNLPEIGPVNVAGIPFSEFRVDVDRRVQEVLIGTQVSVTMGQLRTIRVFVLGDVNQPGSYVVGGLATISSALYRSGGISRVGSLRKVQLKRRGRVVSNLDLYDLLIEGDTSGDRRLQPGDVIFVPPIGGTISVGGAVKRPAVYETIGRMTIAEAIALAGGLAPDAFGQGSRLERIGIEGDRRVESVDLSNESASATLVRPGDILLIPEILPDLTDTVMLSGYVQRPGPYEWRRGMRLTDLITTLDELKPGVDTNYVLIRREDDTDRSVTTLSADLGTALRMPSSGENVLLQARDSVYVFDRAYGRQRLIAPILSELQLQASHDKPYQQAQIEGRVRAPGPYPLEEDMSVGDLIRAGGGLAEQAYTRSAELTRYSIIGGERRVTEIITVNLDAILRGDPAADIPLAPHDHLRVSSVPEWQSTWSVRLDGEVRFPGTYRIRRGETLREVVARAGGLSDEAFPEGAIFLRESLREREQEQNRLLAKRLEADLAALSLETLDASSAETLSTGKVLLEQLRQTEAVGRLVISTSDLLPHDDEHGIELKNGDQLLIPTRSSVVTVIGETQQNTSHLYQPGLSRDDYIQNSGGMTRRADKKLIYVVRANGAVVTGNRSRWFGRGGRTDIRPGDTIVVPLETHRVRPLTFWTSVTQILYQGAIAIAAIETFQ